MVCSLCHLSFNLPHPALQKTYTVRVLNSDTIIVCTNIIKSTTTVLRWKGAALEGAGRRAHLPRAKARCASLVARD